MYSTSEFKKNLKIEIDGHPYVIIEANHVKPGKGNAFVKTKYKSLIDGRVLSQNFRSGDKVERPNLESRQMQYLYKEENLYVFMDTSTYDQFRLSEDAIESALDFLKDSMEIDVLFHNNKPISLELPTFVNLVIQQTDPGFKGDTATGGTKPATLETGATVYVPLYIKEGELVRIDTRTGEFVERVNS